MARLPQKKKAAAPKKKPASKKKKPAKNARQAKPRPVARKKKAARKKDYTLREMTGRGWAMAKRPAGKRHFIDTKEVQIITRKSHRTAQRILEKIRKKAGKPRHSPVTMQEFCNHMVISAKMVNEILGD